MMYEARVVFTDVCSYQYVCQSKHWKNTTDQKSIYVLWICVMVNPRGD